MSFLEVRFGNSNTVSNLFGSSDDIVVTNYNVLSSHLASPSHFTQCNPAHLDAKNRLEKIKEKLSTEVKKKAVICLQEVSQQWAAILHTFLEEKNYRFISALYGSHFNGYMGVAIAIPTDHYDIIDINITCISDTIHKPSHANYCSRALRYIMRQFYTPPLDIWDSALYRTNQMLCTRLKARDSGKSFVVGTYHMPCMFNLPSVMVAHCALSAQHIIKYAKNDPFIYAGDFNIKPNSSEYAFLTEGKIDKSHPHYPQPVPGDEWDPSLSFPLLSAYKTATGSEPDFTNYAKTREDPVFIETLDYLFYSPSLAVKEVEDLPKREAVAGPLPNADEPSDHILISAKFTLP